MTTISLEEALKRATKGPLNLHHNPIIAGPNDEAICRMMNGGNRIMENDEVAMNMVLLAHCYNVLPEMVAMIKGVIELGERELGVNDYPSTKDEPNQHGGRWAYRHEEMLVLLRPILTKATTITLP